MYIKIKPKVNVGDKIIADNQFNQKFGEFIEGEIIEITQHKNVSTMSKDPHYDDNQFSVTILAKINIRDQWTGEFFETTKKIHSCDFALNPIFDVNTSWLGNNGYARALFFTSEELKNEFYKNIMKTKIQFHLNSARSFGWNG